MLDDLGSEPAGFANFSIRGIVFELETEKFESKPVKIPEGRVPQAPISDFEFGVRASCNSALRKNGLAQTRGEI